MEILRECEVLGDKVGGSQGDQMDHCLLLALFENKKVVQIFVLFFLSIVYVLILIRKIDLGYSLGEFFTSSSAHPA
jgi:hypothetical protein